MTPRQSQIADLIGHGMTNKEIARELGISPNTVNEHIDRMLRQHDLRNRAQVALLRNEVH